ncbi:MAG TPA: M14 family zinc carboxypeptidase [Acidobacteriota bacterium]|nr:M14 family zinc carboxypeptidase [Acidobacteriota bacterium]
MPLRSLITLLLLVLGGTHARAEAKEQTAKLWWPEGSYSEDVPGPRDFLGYEIGTCLTDHDPMVAYIRLLAETSPRVRIEHYGRSVEGRDMYLLFISTPENLGRLEEIRRNLADLADPRRLSPEAAEAVINTTRPIAWMNFANDGGETAAFEAGMLLAYQLASGLDKVTQKILENTVVIINPAANPDSHQRFVTWMKASSIGPDGTADPNAAEHHVPWLLSSDGNHYLIDSNRDAFALTQPESRLVARMFHHWHPQIFIDNHGEPDEYYFAPYASPVNLNYPRELREIAEQIGRRTAAYFDHHGWGYAKEEVFDLFYPGYWDSYPSLNGAVGITYETSGGGWKHLRWERPDGSVATLEEGIHQHFIADMATLEFLADHPRETLEYFYNFFSSALKEAETSPVKGYALLPREDPGRAAELVHILLQHGVEVYKGTESIDIEVARSLAADRKDRLTLPAGSWIVPLRQPQKRLIKALFEVNPEIDPAFLAEVEAARRRNEKLGIDVPKEPYGFYDVTAWSLPLLFDVETWEYTRELPAERIHRVTEAPNPPGGLRGEPARYGYLIPYVSDAAAKLAARLFADDFRVALGTRAFRHEGRDFPKGTFLVRVGRNPETLHERIRSWSEELGVEVFPAQGAWSEQGPSLGSDLIVSLKRPRVAVFTDEPTKAVAFGAVHSFFEQRIGYPFTALRADYFDEVELVRYNVLVFPDGSPDGYRKLLGKKGQERLRQWVQAGGVVVAVEGGAEFLCSEDLDLTDVEVIREKPKQEGEEAGAPLDRLPGSIHRIDLNSGYFLGFAYPGRAFVQVRGDRLLGATKRGVNVGIFPEKSHLGGFQWDDTEQVLAGKVYAADVPAGRGHVVLFSGDPTFRAYWRGLDRLFWNAVFLTPSF